MAASMVEPQIDSAVMPVEEDWASGLLTLPGGILGGGGACLKAVRVRELTGRDEELLSDRRYRNAAEQVTDFLAQVILEVPGLNEPISKDLTGRMLIGDRDYLLLRLRQLSLGDKVEQVMRCPATTCGKKSDVEFLISELPVHRLSVVQPWYDLDLSGPAKPDDDTSRHLVLRLPTGRDLEAILDCKDLNPALANTRLFALIIKSAGRGRLDESAARDLALRLRSEVTDFLRATAPGPDLRIEIQCPHCGVDMSYGFDLHSFFLPNG